MYKINHVLYLIIIPLLLIQSISFGQTNNEYIEKSTFKKIQKSILEADKYLKKSKDIELEIAELKDKKNLTDDSEKVIKLIEEKNDFLSKYYETHRSITELYKSDYINNLAMLENDSASYEMHIIRAKLSFEDAKSMFQSASNMLQSALIPDTEANTKFQKLEQIKLTHTNALNKLKESLDFYNKKIPSETSNYISDNEKVKINTELLANIQEKLRNINENEDVFYRYSEILSQKGLNGDEALNIWYSYLNRKSLGKTTPEPTSNQLADTTKSVSTGDSVAAAQMIYKVQIANNNEPLSQNTLRKLYNGSNEIKQTYEQGQYKYLIGNFNNYSSAEEFKKQLGVEHAFVVAYSSEPQTIPINDGLADNNTNTVNNQTYNNSDNQNTVNNYVGSSNIVFKVQIAANRSPLSNDYLSRLYSGNYSIDKHYYNNWHKYSIGEFNNFKEAKNLKNIVTIEGAFITAYKNNQKMELWKAIQESSPSATTYNYTSQSSAGSPTYKLQLAASRKPLSQKEIAALYTGSEKISTHHQKGWYLYSIGSFNNYKKALDFKTSNSIENSFITIYRNGQRSVPPLIEDSYNPSFSSAITVKSGIDYTTNVLFKVQIAASRNKLSEKYLKRLYNGSETITESHEAPWYKYTIGNFSTINEAKRFRQSLNVSGAFVVAYKNGIRISMSEATK